MIRTIICFLMFVRMIIATVSGHNTCFQTYGNTSCDGNGREVLMYEGEICDARFSKCCGGAFEEFQYCWEDKKHPYLSRQRDSKKCTELPDLRLETEAEKWIKSIPDSFCNTTDQRILRQVLNIMIRKP